MNINELIKNLEHLNLYYAIYLVVLPVLALCYHYVYSPGKGEEAPHKYIYSGLIYMSSIPGIFGTIITSYTLFILRGNLLNVNVIIYFLPIISMITTIIFIRRQVDLDDIPGFEKLSGLFMILGVTFILTLILLKTRIFLFFGGSIGTFFLLLIFLFALLKWGTYVLFKRKKDKHRKPPKFPY